MNWLSKLFARKRVLYPNIWAAHSKVCTVERPSCICMGSPAQGTRKRALHLHDEAQDTSAPGWQHLLDLVEQAARDGRREFAPALEIDPVHWTQMMTLPDTIARLKRVQHLVHYGSSLVRIPPAIGEMTSFEVFTPYTSYRLHWFPYEITRCPRLKESTVSTRALYGNYKHRSPFPRLPQSAPGIRPESCSVCQGPFGEREPLQAWISLTVATDVLPLLVHACSKRCLETLPSPPEGYMQKPHQGGLGLAQPERKS